jgi:hypothetical protein
MEDLEAKLGKRASAMFNGDFFLIETWSGYRSLFRDNLGAQHFLEPNSNDESLGHAVLDALSRSRFCSLEEIQSRRHSDRMAEEYATWVQSLMVKYGYKDKRALFKSMMNCNVKLAGGFITIGPMIHDSLDGWIGFPRDENNPVIIPASSTAEEVGAALRLAFSRCE